MTYSPLLLLHIVTGLISVAAGFAAMLFRKGSRRHRASGNVFVIAMLVMASTGACLALLKSERFNILAGTLTFYLVATAWLAVGRRERETGPLDYALLLLALGAAATGVVFGWQGIQRAALTGGQSPAVAYAIFVTFALLSSVSDVRMLLRGGIVGASRMIRHVWRMGFSLFLATASFFLGTASNPVLKRTGLRAQLFPQWLRDTHLPLIPVLIVVALILYWLGRVLFTNEYKRERRGANVRTSRVFAWERRLREVVGKGGRTVG